MQNTTARKDVYSRITAQIVEYLEKGVRPWTRPWNAEHAAGRITRPLRFNGQSYSGINVLSLWMSALSQNFARADLDDLTDFVKPDGELPIPRPLLIHNALFETLSSSFAPSQITQSGRTVDTAVFLSVTNAGEQQAANMSLHSQDSIPDFHHLGKGESVLLCVELDYLNGKIVKLPIDEVSLSTANGHTYSVRVEPVPDRSAMAAVPGNRKGVFLGYPKYSK